MVQNSMNFWSQIQGQFQLNLPKHAMSECPDPFSTWAALHASLHGRKVESILAQYAMYYLSPGCDNDVDQIRAQFFFELFVDKMIPLGDAYAICRKYWCTLIPVLKQLACLQTGPLPVFHAGTSGNWTVEETLNLLYCLKEGNAAMMPIIFAHRTLNQCRDRIRYLLLRLERRNVTETCVPLERVDDRKGESVASIKNQYTMLKVRMMREKYAARKERARLNARCLVLQRKIKKLEDVVNQMEFSDEKSGADESDATQPLGDTRLQDQLLSEMLFSSHQQQRRYSDQMRDICQLIHLTSPKAYRLLQQFLPLPSSSCLRYHYAQNFALTRQLLTEIDMLDHHMSKLFAETPENCLCTIGIDAFAFRTFSEKSTFKTQNESSFSDAFLFMHIPLDPNLPPKVLHIEKKRNGAFNASIMEVFDQILSRYRDRNMKVLFLATDGDRYLSSLHEQFFLTHVEGRTDFLILISHIFEQLMNSNEVMPISDPLHFTKNVRGKLLDHDIAVVDAEKLVFVNAEKINKYLEISPALTDKGQIGRMRDKYVTDIFTLRNVCYLLAQKGFHSAFLMLPYSCIFTVLYAINITPEARLFLVNLAFTCFERMLSEAYEIVKNHNAVKFRYSAGVQGITFAEPGYIKRMIHTCLALGIGLVFGPRHVRLDSIGTHLLENTIGIARSVSNSTDFERITSAFANAEMRKELGAKWHLQLHIPHRINDGGAKVDTLSDEGVPHMSHWDPRDVVSQLHELCLDIRTPEGEAEWDTFFNEFRGFVDSVRIRHLDSSSAVANALIVERNRLYHGKQDTEP